jgi:peptide/nickel transport system substrate-binding protein
VEERQAIIAEMQQIVYDDVPEVVLYYNNTLEAYRSDKWDPASFVESPEPQGFLIGQYTPYTELVMRPVGFDTGTGTGGTGGDDGGGSSTGIILAVVGVLIAVVVIVVLMRRGRNEEDLA